ncbi:Hypothetical predicted protein, partial [Olea europaea subsp. europaea]
MICDKGARRRAIVGRVIKERHPNYVVAASPSQSSDATSVSSMSDGYSPFCATVLDSSSG